MDSIIVWLKNILRIEYIFIGHVIILEAQQGYWKLNRDRAFRNVAYIIF